MRPKINKKICCCPVNLLFSPSDCKTNAPRVVLSLEEVEALNLKNIQKLDQNEAAESMGISQSTFQRILSSAYTKVSDALVNGKEIKIDDKSSVLPLKS